MQNAHTESFHRILVDECLAGQQFDTFTEAYRTVAQFTDFYSKRRIHSNVH
ncbi:MAG TPA: transposase [Firmicutes bacterium]|nr:transposase [Bacillota bacterium]